MGARLRTSYLQPLDDVNVEGGLGMAQDVLRTNTLFTPASHGDQSSSSFWRVDDYIHTIAI